MADLTRPAVAPVPAGGSTAAPARAATAPAPATARAATAPARARTAAAAAGSDPVRAGSVPARARTAAAGAGSDPVRSANAATTVRAQARITAEPDGRGGTALPELAGAGPLALRRTRDGEGGAARVTVIGSMAGPLGGDRIGLRIDVRAGAALHVASAAATVSLPGPHTGPHPVPAHYDLDLTVGEDATLHWLPEQVVAASGSHLITRVRIRLAAGARLRYREEQVLGRHHDWSTGTPPGRLTTRLTVTRTGRTVLDQQTDIGPGAPAWNGPAVLGPHRTAGQLLTVGDPAPPPPPPDTDAVLLILPTPDATLLTALAPDALALRRLLLHPAAR
ncbi:urease accessory protein UreD [Kitasatospora terrestris]|uniref:Urease accessory protein UreD n=1 Tax=Kitasatospora terrestris TaxID=258051 RepID=A0ABP9EKN5_9ACTN